MTRRGCDLPALLAAARRAEPRALGRLLSMVEDVSPRLREIAAALAPYTGRAHVVGVTGAPGVGKSTWTAALVEVLRARGRRVAVVAVDPSSPFTGGALLGDRVRMQGHAVDDGVFIRSMASRGHLGGIAWATPQAVRVLDAAGFDVIVVETVGVGQSEVDVARSSDTTVVLVAPGAGDAIQVAKAGVLEIGDLYVVNKADRDGAEALRRDLRQMLALGADGRPDGGPGPRPEIRLTVATAGTGLDEVADALDRHRDAAAVSGSWDRRRRERLRGEIEALAVASLRDHLGRLAGGADLDVLAGEVLAGRLDVYAAADRVVADVAQSPTTP